MHSRCIDQIRGSVFFPGLVNSSLHSLCMACKKKGRALSPLLRFSLCSLSVRLKKQRPGSRHFLSFFHCSPFVRLQNSPGQFLVIPRGSPALRFRLSSWFALGSALKTLSKTFQTLGRQTGPFFVFSLCWPSVDCHFRGQEARCPFVNSSGFPRASLGLRFCRPSFNSPWFPLASIIKTPHFILTSAGENACKKIRGFVAFSCHFLSFSRSSLGVRLKRPL